MHLTILIPRRRIVPFLLVCIPILFLFSLLTPGSYVRQTGPDDLKPSLMALRDGRIGPFSALRAKYPAAGRFASTLARYQHALEAQLLVDLDAQVHPVPSEGIILVDMSDYPFSPEYKLGPQLAWYPVPDGQIAWYTYRQSGPWSIDPEVGLNYLVYYSPLQLPTALKARHFQAGYIVYRVIPPPALIFNWIKSLVAAALLLILIALALGMDWLHAVLTSRRRVAARLALCQELIFEIETSLDMSLIHQDDSIRHAYVRGLDTYAQVQEQSLQSRRRGDLARLEDRLREAVTALETVRDEMNTPHSAIAGRQTKRRHSHRSVG